MRLGMPLALCIAPVIAAALLVPHYAPMLERYVSEEKQPVAMAVNTPPPLSGSVRVRSGSDGHFRLTGRVGARQLPFMVDTGATLVALTWETGRDLGLISPGDELTIPISTANGTLYAKKVTIGRLRVEGLEVSDVPALVLPKGALGTNLLGMSFLSKLRHFEIARGDLLLEL